MNAKAKRKHALAKADAEDPSGNMLEAYTGRRPEAVQEQAPHFAAASIPSTAPAAAAVSVVCGVVWCGGGGGVVWCGVVCMTELLRSAW